jgi:ABC-type dipeptide/oligopeptide/nickel transport system permease subunit
MEHRQVPDTWPWIVAFLGLALTMIVAAFALLAFWPPLR